MGWKQERDLLIAQTMAFVQSVTGKRPDADTSAETQPRVPAALPIESAPAVIGERAAPAITATEMLAADIIAPPQNIQPDEVSLRLPKAIVSNDIRSEIQARVANFRAHQERFHREREEYFSATLREARAAIGSAAAPGMPGPQHRLIAPASRSSQAPAANAARMPPGSRSSESGQGPS